VVSPLVRGLFGLDWDATTKHLHVNPHLPAEWDRTKLRNVQVGKLSVDLEMERIASGLRVRALTKTAETLCLNKTCDAAPAMVRGVMLALPAVEVGIPATLPEPGERTRQLKALSEEWSEHNAAFTFEGWVDAKYDLPLRLNRTGISMEGARVDGGKLHLEFPGRDSGYVRKTVTFRW